jgi:hypothetical protein
MLTFGHCMSQSQDLWAHSLWCYVILIQHSALQTTAAQRSPAPTCHHASG